MQLLGRQLLTQKPAILRKISLLDPELGPVSEICVIVYKSVCKHNNFYHEMKIISVFTVIL